jgi:hypothetical protein
MLRVAIVLLLTLSSSWCIAQETKLTPDERRFALILFRGLLEETRQDWEEAVRMYTQALGDKQGSDRLRYELH